MDARGHFRPRGDTFLVMGSTPVSGATRAGGPAGGEVVYMMYNNGAGNAFVGYGMTSQAAIDNAVVPVVGVPRPTLSVPNGTVRAFTLSPLLFFAAVTPSGQAPLYITPGEGLI